MTYSPDVNEITDTDTTNAGRYLMFQIFTAIANIVGLIILVAVVVIILNAFGLNNIIKFGKRG